MATVSRVSFGSPVYEQLLELRDRTLRKPLGLEFSEEQLKAEREQQHFAIFEGEMLVGCLIAAPLGPSAHHLRQMTIEPAYQGRGLGKQLVEFVVEQLRKQGATRLVLHSRDTAVGFYERLGFRPVGEPFVEVSIPHQEMELTLA